MASVDAFEELVSEVLRAEGYWVHRGYKIDLTVEEKRQLDNPFMPRPEIDLVAYKAASNELLALECKSYFDSRGVHADDLLPGSKNGKRYKMFVNDALRTHVLATLHNQLSASGTISSEAVPRLGLVYGYATAGNEAKLRTHFETQDWLLLGPNWLRQQLVAMAARS